MFGWGMWGWELGRVFGVRGGLSDGVWGCRMSCIEPDLPSGRVTNHAGFKIRGVRTSGTRQIKVRTSNFIYTLFDGVGLFPAKVCSNRRCVLVFFFQFMTILSEAH